MSLTADSDSLFEVSTFSRERPRSFCIASLCKLQNFWKVRRQVKNAWCFRLTWAVIEEDPGSFCNFNTIPWLLLGHFDIVVLTPARSNFWCQSHYHLETHSTTTIILPYYQNVQSIENDLLRRLLFYTATFWYRRLQSKRKYCYCRSSFALLFIIVSHLTSSPINWISYWKQTTCY